MIKTENNNDAARDAEQISERHFKIWATCDGMMGRREGWLKDINGNEKVFETQEQADAEAHRLNFNANSNPYSTAYFSYRVREINA